MMKNGLIFLLLALLALALAGNDRQPRAAIEDTTRAEVTATAAAADPPKPPRTWHLNSTCLIETVQQGEHSV